MCHVARTLRDCRYTSDPGHRCRLLCRLHRTPARADKQDGYISSSSPLVQRLGLSRCARSDRLDHGDCRQDLSTTSSRPSVFKFGRRFGSRWIKSACPKSHAKRNLLLPPRRRARRPIPDDHGDRSGSRAVLSVLQGATMRPGRCGRRSRANFFFQRPQRC